MSLGMDYDERAQSYRAISHILKELVMPLGPLMSQEQVNFIFNQLYEQDQRIKNWVDHKANPSGRFVIEALKSHSKSTIVIKERKLGIVTHLLNLLDDTSIEALIYDSFPIEHRLASKQKEYFFLGQEISEQDIPFVRVGAPFYQVKGFEIFPGGKKRFSYLEFQPNPPFTEEELSWFQTHS